MFYITSLLMKDLHCILNKKVVVIILAGIFIYLIIKYCLQKYEFIHFGI